ncbi:SAM-dependent methyltransferase [Burkholderia multivorans]|uniref:nicotianamine synthase family protein n=1 Tax=Burkholderia multivorans TaxID=87883 RepID=UPI001C2632D6|nr:nicotianamine synthase family protein [Burkholderia multivorans]MBU9561945.1 SAM-dependent methyltransferase [Burkholderia multivorans]
MLSHLPLAPRCAANDTQNRIDFVKTQIHRWIDEMFVSPDRHDLRACFAKTLLIRNYLLSPVLDANETERFLRDATVREYMQRFQALSLDNEVRFERQMSDVLRAGPSSEGLLLIIKEYYAEIYRLLARTEMFLSDMSADSTVAMVGSGGMPLSLLFMQSFSGARIVGLDLNEESLRTGERFVDHLCASNPARYRRGAIEMVHADGAAYDYGACDIIILSIHIENKLEIVKRIIETAPRDRRVIVVERQVHGLGQYFYPNYGFDSDRLPVVKLASLSSSLLVSTAYELER